MAEVALYNGSGERVGTVQLDPAVFDTEMNEPLLHQVVTAQLANSHQGTSSTLTRGEVRRSGRKAWRQKGTGRARQGTRSAPHWTGGGVTFGPRPGLVEKHVPKKMRKKAMGIALSAKVADEAFYVVESLELPEGKTRNMISILDNMGLSGKKVLLVLEAADPIVAQASANINGTRTQTLQQTSVVDLMRYHHVIMTQAAVHEVEGRLSV